MALRLVETIRNTQRDECAKVYRDTEFDEYRVRFYKADVLNPADDYHTDDKGDAQRTARAAIWN